MIGQTISHYKILEKLGEGGMGVVYKAQDTKLDRLVALKFLPERVSTSEEDRVRFIQEAKAAASLNHANICTIHGVDDHEGQMFIVMEFVEGKTLREIRDTLSIKQAYDIGIQLADGLAAAHEKGIVHRDIKPENIMIRKDGRVQIMDFGLAKLKGVSRLTKEGSTIGTVGYMSPEQVQGQDADHRTDIFSLGVVLYELFTGQLPFKGVHETAITYEIINIDPTPMSSLKPEIQPELDAIALECLAKEPPERYQSAAEVAKELRRFKRESTRARATRTMATRQYTTTTREHLVETPNLQRWYARFFLPALSVLLGIAVLMMGWMIWKKEPTVNRPVMRFSIDLPQNAPMGGGTSALDISPDGKYLVYVSQLANLTQLYLRRMDQLDVQPLSGTEGAAYPFFSPDGQWIAFHVGDKLKKISVFGGAPEDICETSGLIRGGWWGPENAVFYGHLNKAILRVSAQGGKPEVVTFLDSAGGEISHRFPQLLPDGKTMVFTIKLNNIATFDEAVIAAQRLGRAEKKILVRGGTYARYLPTGHLLYVRGKSFFVVPFDADNLEVKGPPTQLFDGGWLNPFSGDATFSFSKTGVLAYVPLGSSSFDINTVAWMDRHGKIQSLLEKPRPYFNGTLSPDGQKLALTINAANDDIWVYHLTRGTLTRLTFGGGNHGFPIWTPDGKYVVYSAEKGKSPNLFRKPWDGSGAEERLTQSDQQQLPTSFTPDGKQLSFIQNGNIWILPLDDDRKPRPFIQSPGDKPVTVFSPDGRWIAYVSNESGKYEVFVTSFPKQEGKWQISTGGGVGPIWSRNGKELFYLNGTALLVVDVSLRPMFDYSAPRKVCEIPPFTIGPWDITIDGQRFMMVVAPAQQITTTKVNVVLEWFEELKEKFSGKR